MTTISTMTMMLHMRVMTNNMAAVMNLLVTSSLVYGAVSFTKREISNKESHTSGPYCYDKRKTTSVIRNPSMKHTRSAMLSMMLS